MRGTYVENAYVDWRRMTTEIKVTTKGILGWWRRFRRASSSSRRERWLVIGMMCGGVSVPVPKDEVTGRSRIAWSKEVSYSEGLEDGTKVLV